MNADHQRCDRCVISADITIPSFDYEGTPFLPRRWFFHPHEPMLGLIAKRIELLRPELLAMTMIREWFDYEVRCRLTADGEKVGWN